MEKTEAIPKWMMRRYALLYRTFQDKDFTLDESAEAIKEDRKVILVLLSRLRRMGWIEAEFDKEDARKRIYKLKPVEKILEAMQT